MQLKNITLEVLPFTELDRYADSQARSKFVHSTTYDQEAVLLALRAYPGDDLKERVWNNLPWSDREFEWNQFFGNLLRERTSHDVNKMLAINTLWVVDRYFVFDESMSTMDIISFKDVFTFFISILRDYVEHGKVDFNPENFLNVPCLNPPPEAFGIPKSLITGPPTDFTAKEE